MAEPTQDKLPALKLTLGGAPNTPHVIPGFPGVYFPHEFSPVGGDGELTLEQAQAAHDAEGCPLELSYVGPRTIARARKLQEKHLGPAIRASRELAREPDVAGAELVRASDQVAAATGQTDPDALPTTVEAADGEPISVPAGIVPGESPGWPADEQGRPLRLSQDERDELVRNPPGDEAGDPDDDKSAGEPGQEG